VTHVPPYPGSGWSGGDGPGRKIWGLGGGTPPPPGDCTSAIVGALTYDTGEFHNVDAHTPVTVTPTIAPLVPSAILALWAGDNQTESMCLAPLSESVSGAYTGYFDSRLGAVGSYPSLAMAGYVHVASGLGGAMVNNFASQTGTAAKSHRGIAVAIETASAAPVQVATQYGTGGFVTFGAPVTPGNLLIVAAYCENDPNPTFPIEWTYVYGPVLILQGVNTGSITFGMRCAVEADSTVITVGNPGKSHWQSVAEWAIT
jgi:hypothetical protein